MTSVARHVIFAIGAVLFVPAMLRAIWDLPFFGQFQGTYGLYIDQFALHERHVLNVVTSVIFDYRGLDTLGEEFILFTSVTAVSLIMREEREDEAYDGAFEVEPHKGVGPALTDATVMIAYVLAGIIIVYGAYTIIQGHLSLGGGFQGGLIVSAAWMALAFACGARVFHRFASQFAMEMSESLGAGAYAVIGFIPLFMGFPFLKNVLPLGETGKLLSGGTIFLINLGVGIEVASGFILLAVEFLKPLQQTEARRMP
jgi:multicomponent Na+:H+ antiporter subunit B